MVPRHDFSEAHPALWMMTLLLALGAAAVFYLKPFAPSRTSPFLDLKASDLNGQMRVQWDPKAEEVRLSQHATLEVIEGDQTTRYQVEDRVLLSGIFDYSRKSDDVLLRLSLFRDGQQRQGVVRSVGVPPMDEPAVVPKKTAPRRPARASRRRR